MSLSRYWMYNPINEKGQDSWWTECTAIFTVKAKPNKTPK